MFIIISYHSSQISSMQDQNIQVDTIQQTKQKWDRFAEFYTNGQSAPQSFYFTLINMLDLPHATNILEVGCGAGLLIPYALQIKNKEATYLATDLSDKMVQLSKKRFAFDIQRYHSKVTVEEWMKENKLSIRAANGQQLFEQGEKFDRIICNMVMMLTESADNMLANFYKHAKPGCLLGVSVWGDKARSTKFSVLEQAMKENGIDTSKARSEFHLYKLLGEKAIKAGWKVLLQWDQTSVFPYLRVQQASKFIQNILRNNPLPQQKKDAIIASFKQKMMKKFQQKEPALFSAQLYIFKKQ